MENIDIPYMYKLFAMYDVVDKDRTQKNYDRGSLVALIDKVLYKLSIANHLTENRYTELKIRNEIRQFVNRHLHKIVNMEIT